MKFFDLVEFFSFFGWSDCQQYLFIKSSDLIVCCLDLHFSNPMSDSRMVFRGTHFDWSGHFDAKLECV